MTEKTIPDEVHLQHLLLLAAHNEKRHGDELYVSAADTVLLKRSGGTVVSEGIQSGGGTYYTRIRYAGFLFINACLMPEEANRHKRETEFLTPPAVTH